MRRSQPGFLLSIAGVFGILILLATSGRSNASEVTFQFDTTLTSVNVNPNWQGTTPLSISAGEVFQSELTVEAVPFTDASLSGLDFKFFRDGNTWDVDNMYGKMKANFVVSDNGAGQFGPFDSLAIGYFESPIGIPLFPIVEGVVPEDPTLVWRPSLDFLGGSDAVPDFGSLGIADNWNGYTGKVLRGNVFDSVGVEVMSFEARMGTFTVVPEPSSLSGMAIMLTAAASIFLRK